MKALTDDGDKYKLFRYIIGKYGLKYSMLNYGNCGISKTSMGNHIVYAYIRQVSAYGDFSEQMKMNSIYGIFARMIEDGFNIDITAFSNSRLVIKFERDMRDIVMNQNDEEEIKNFQDQGHLYYCACRQVWGDGECECRQLIVSG